MAASREPSKGRKPSDRPGRGRQGGWGKRRVLAVAGLAVGLLIVLGVVTVGLPLLRFWLQIRPIDHTVAHGDDCLADRQGENFRCWDLYVPPAAADERVPLVIDIHGFLNRPGTQRDYSEFDELAAEEGFIVAWPYGIRWSWNGGGDPWPAEREIDERPGIGCCGYALNEGLDDVTFIRSMIEELIATRPVDPDRVYLSGFSTGCFLAQRVAVEASDVVAGVACMSGFLLVDPPPDYDPIPIITFNGTDDDVAPYGADYWPGAEANFERWRTLNRCRDTGVEVWRDGDHDRVESTDCANGATVALVTLTGIGHVVYEGHDDLSVDTTRMAWEFLSGV